MDCEMQQAIFQPQIHLNPGHLQSIDGLCVYMCVYTHTRIYIYIHTEYLFQEITSYPQDAII